MDDNLFTNSDIFDEPADSTESTVDTEDKKDNKDNKKGGELKFFKSCSASLKRFSVIIFVINIFIALTLVGVGAVLLGVYIGFEMLALLALPLLTALVILILLARFISALIYGFAEIVEKRENE